MFIKDWKKEIFTIPNLLSLFRLLLIPVYVWIYLQEEYFLASAILAVSCLTDLIDGKIARHFDMITNLGKVLDPLADKLTQFALIVCLCTKHPVLLYLIGLFVIKELFQLIAGSINLRKGIMLRGALLSGKICTTILFISLIVMVLLPNLSEDVILIITVIDAIFMLIAFVHYVIVYFSKNNKFQSIKGNDK